MTNNKVTLSDGRQVPTLGLGTWRSNKNEVSVAVEKAITEYHYRHIDCASIYGNEAEIGSAFHRVFSQKKVSREEVFVTSKLWNTEHHPDNVEAACQKTLHNLRLEYLDLYLIHWGIAFEHGRDLEPIGDDGLVKTAPIAIQQTWKAMEKLVDKGLVKSIGVANFTVPMIVDLLSFARIRPVMNQVEIHPYNTQEELTNYCHKQNIQVTAYSPLGSSASGVQKPINDPSVTAIAQRIGRTPAQILIRWALQRYLIVIPKSTNEARISENSQVYDFALEQKEMEENDTPRPKGRGICHPELVERVTCHGFDRLTMTHMDDASVEELDLNRD